MKIKQHQNGKTLTINFGDVLGIQNVKVLKVSILLGSARE